ncbi:MAG TPA: helix-turn-helix domain-containing protein [Herpetosiphonaceae bacterium]
MTTNTDEIGTAEAARILGCSAATVQQAIRNKRLSAHITPSGYRLKRADVEQYKTTKRKPGRPRETEPDIDEIMERDRTTAEALADGFGDHWADSDPEDL